MKLSPSVHTENLTPTPHAESWKFCHENCILINRFMLPVKVLEEGAWPTLEHRTLSFRKALADTAQTMLDLAFPASETEKMHVCLFFFLNELPSYIDFVGATEWAKQKQKEKYPLLERRPCCQLCPLLAVSSQGAARFGTVLACDHLPAEGAQAEVPQQGTQPSRMPSYIAMPLSPFVRPNTASDGFFRPQCFCCIVR